MNNQAVLNTIDMNELDQVDNSIDRIKPFELDDYYIKYFIERPTNKTKAYRKARSELGFESTHNDSYSAYILHRRLASRINDTLLQEQVDNRALGQAKLRYLAENADSESVQANVSTTLFNDGRDKQENAGIVVNVNRDNVEITHKNQTLTVKPVEE